MSFNLSLSLLYYTNPAEIIHVSILRVLLVEDLFSKYSVAEYEAAGVTVINPGYLYNEKYKLTNSGKDLETNWAERAVIFYDYRGRPAWNLKELTYWYWDVYLPEICKVIKTGVFDN